MTTSSLVTCRACGKLMSRNAVACPDCGEPASRGAAPSPDRRTNPWMIIGWIVLIVIMLPLATCAGLFLYGASQSGGASQSDRAGSAFPSSPPVLAPSALRHGYDAALAAGSTETAANYAELLRKHYPDSAEAKSLPPTR